MGKLRYFLLIMLVLGLITAGFAQDQNIVLIKESQNSPQVVKVSAYLLNLGKFDVSTGAFTADFYLSMTCETECDPTGFEFVNGRAATFDKIIDTPKEKFYRISANLSSPVDLKKFPFDTQKMQIIIEDKKKTTSEIMYVADTNLSGIDESIVFTGWDLAGWSTRVKEHDYKVYGEKYSQFVFEINIARITVNSILKTFLPVFFIVLVVLFSFLLDPDKVTTRLGMAGSSLVAAVMFHISIANQIPPVGYLTFADKFMALTYGILLASFIINIVLLELGEKKKELLVKKIHSSTEYTMFIIVPLLYLVLFLFFI
jgi:hypothetical protein